MRQRVRTEALLAAANALELSRQTSEEPLSVRSKVLIDRALELTRQAMIVIAAEEISAND